MTPDQFNSAYWAAQPKAIRAIRALPTEAERDDCARALARQGLKLDYAILVLGAEPYAVMQGRATNGYEWYPAIGEPHPGYAPGCALPGMIQVPMGPAWGSIRVSVDPKHYPVIIEEESKPVAVPPVGIWIAPLNGYDCRDAAAKPGDEATAPDGAKVRLAIVLVGPFASARIWRKQ